MSFAGHVQQMIRSNANNAALRKSRKERLQGIRKVYTSNGTRKPLSFKRRKQHSPEDLAQINAKNKRIIIHDRKIANLKTAFVSSIILAILAFVIYNVLINIH